MNKALLGIGACAAWALSGCTGLEPALIGAAISGTQTGVTLLSGAEVWDFREVSYAETRLAVGRVGERFALEFVRDRVDDEEGEYWVRYRYDGRLLTIEVQRLTPTITSVEIDTRSKSQQGMARLFVEAMVEELDAIAAEHSETDPGA